MIHPSGTLRRGRGWAAACLVLCCALTACSTRLDRDQIVAAAEGRTAVTRPTQSQVTASADSPSATASADSPSAAAGSTEPGLGAEAGPGATAPAGGSAGSAAGRTGGTTGDHALTRQVDPSLSTVTLGNIGEYS